MDRRDLLKAAGGTTLGYCGGQLGANDSLVPARLVLDHLLFGTADLDEGIGIVRDRTGLTPLTGGSHPGAGTRNALLSLGARQYLEIIAPDPAQSSFNFQVDLRMLRRPRLITWAAATNAIAGSPRHAQEAGLTAIGPRDGSRRKPDGTLLEWKTLGIQNDLMSSEVIPVPFLIQWGEGVRHPSLDEPTSCRIKALEFAHPDVKRLEATLRKLGIKATVERGPEVRITATIRTPKGIWILT